MAAAIAAFVVFGSAGATEGDARAFIDAMLAGVDAVELPCPDLVLARTREHEMTAVCAHFDGAFDDFRERWSRHLERDAAPGRQALPLARSETPWRLLDGNYERIYSVSQTVIGVRFNQGVILAVYK